MERALRLVEQGLIKNSEGKKHYTIAETENPATGKLSTVATGFSSERWNQRTLWYLKNIKNINDQRFEKIYEDLLAKRPRRRGRGLPDSDDMEDEDDLLKSEGDAIGEGGDQINEGG